MPDVAIITSIYDNYDSLKPVLPQAGLDVEWVVVTDTIPNAEEAEGWAIIHNPLPGTTPVRAAKKAKFLPWLYTDAPISIWVDASFRVISTGFARDMMSFADPVGQFPHPCRDCIYTEAKEVIRVGKDPETKAAYQMECYRQAGHPPRWGLWASGVIIRKHTDLVKLLGYGWSAEVEAGSHRDQLSQAYVLRELGLRPASLPGSIYTSRWLRYEGSRRHK